LTNLDLIGLQNGSSNPNVTITANVTFIEQTSVISNISEVPYQIGNSSITALEFTTLTNLTFSNNTNLDQNINTFNFDMFAELASDLDETPYLLSARTLYDGI